MARPHRIALLLAGVVAACLAGGPTGPAAAITHGSPDGADHPMVGLMVASDDLGRPLWTCTGTLLSPTIYLTAGHCTEAPATHVEVWFEPGHVPLAPGFPAPGERVCAGVGGYPCTGTTGGSPYTHPDYDPAEFHRHDLGVVRLDTAVRLPEYARLPVLDQLDALSPSRRTVFTTVGYGLQRSFPDAASWKDEERRVRLVAEPHLIRIGTGFGGDFAITVSANAATGGTCTGDSGGPHFLGSSLVVAGVTSYARNDTCAGQSGVYRVDRADDLDWLAAVFGGEL